MARRQCDDCGANMGPYEPRTRVGDKMLCDACKDGSRGGMVSKTAADDHDVLYHLTDKHQFALDPEYAPQDNTFAIEDRSGRKGLYGVSDPWGVNSWKHKGYQRPYVAEVHVPKGLAQDGRWGNEKFLPAEHYDKATVHRVMTGDQHDQETYYGAQPGGRDVRDFTPEEHTKHLLDLRNRMHDENHWGWNEFNDKHEHVGSDEDDDQGMPVRRDRDGNVMTMDRYSSRRTATWSSARHPHPIVHTPGRKPPRPLMTGDTLLWESGHSEPITGHSESLLMTPGGIKHRRPIEGDHSQTIFATDPDLESEMGSIGSPEAEDYLRSNPTGPTKFSTRKVAHDSGDGMTVFHCPFCGSGQVLARSDRTIECQFCHTAFTVQVQPVYPNFPQTIDGQPMQVPGMPGQVDPMGGGMPPGAGAPPSGDEEPGDSPFGSDDLDDSGVPPTDEADAEADDDSGSGDSSGHEKETGNPFAKKTYRTAKGHLLSEADYLRHIAITTSPDPLLTAAQIKMARLSDCTTCGGSGYATKDPSGQRTFTCPCCHGAGAHEPGDECSSLEDLDYDGGR